MILSPPHGVLCLQSVLLKFQKTIEMKVIKERIKYKLKDYWVDYDINTTKVVEAKPLSKITNKEQHHSIFNGRDPALGLRKLLNIYSRSSGV